MGHRRSGIGIAWARSDYEDGGMDILCPASGHTGWNIVAVLIPARPSPRVSCKPS